MTCGLGDESGARIKVFAIRLGRSTRGESELRLACSYLELSVVSEKLNMATDNVGQRT